jgi:hypothetical protein
MSLIFFVSVVSGQELRSTRLWEAQGTSNFFRAQVDMVPTGSIQNWCLAVVERHEPVSKLVVFGDRILRGAKRMPDFQSDQLFIVFGHLDAGYNLRWDSKVQVFAQNGTERLIPVSQASCMYAIIVVYILCELIGWHGYVLHPGQFFRWYEQRQPNKKIEKSAV